MCHLHYHFFTDDLDQAVSVFDQLNVAGCYPVMRTVPTPTNEDQLSASYIISEYAFYNKDETPQYSDKNLA